MACWPPAEDPVLNAARSADLPQDRCRWEFMVVAHGPPEAPPLSRPTDMPSSSTPSRTTTHEAPRVVLRGDCTVVFYDFDQGGKTAIPQSMADAFAASFSHSQRQAEMTASSKL